MRTFLFAAAALAAVATPALAQGIDSKHSPYPASAYPGFIGNAAVVAAPVRATRFRPAPAYRYSGPHAGGPADDLAR
ncbi:hypothetical protein [Methylobacterium sp. OT2]|uniref:hypothetical protein n=1 Tax=Methylobacterium sp. OT2 TaxID=2813779 RepID=UPI00197BC102|nr:hypothetical protein [Methylobacterium sp. OT2]MBN4096023.1 hypothetical protein [Methylobacterium sp. OT2]